LTLSLYKEGKELLNTEDKILIISPATEDDYWTLSNEDLKVEYGKEKLYIHSPANWSHEECVTFLLRYINRYLEDHSLGKAVGSRFAIKLPNGRRPEPDVVVLLSHQISTDMTVFEGVPPLIIEIISKSTKDHDLGEKLEWYKSAKIPEIWIIDRDETWVRHYLLIEREYSVKELKSGSLKSKLFSGLQLKVEWLWEKPLPKLKDIYI